MPDSLEIHTHEFFPKWGGIGRYCQEFARGAAELGWNVTLHGPGTARPPTGAPTEPYRLKRGPHGPSHGPLNIWRSRRYLAASFRASPESLHLLAEPGPILACGLLPRRKWAGRIQLVLHGSEIERWASSTMGSRLVVGRALCAAGTIIVPSEAISTRLRAAFPEAATPVRVVPHALPRYFRLQAEAFQLAQKPQDKRKFKLLGVGRIHPRKGFDQVLAAIAQLDAEEKAALHYTIAGSRCDPRYEQRLRQEAENSGIQVEFAFDPGDDALAAHYRAADLFVLTSLPRRKSVEGFGLVYLEAAAFGLPCLAYRTGGVDAAVADGETGYLLPVGQPQALAQKLRSLLRRTSACADIGLRARKKALARDWSHVAGESLP